MEAATCLVYIFEDNNQGQLYDILSGNLDQRELLRTIGCVCKIRRTWPANNFLYTVDFKWILVLKMKIETVNLSDKARESLRHRKQ